MRARRTLALLFATGLAGAGLGCSHRVPNKEEQKRALLKPRDVKREQQDEERKRQVLDTDGDLIPSDQIVAGVVLPRGLLLRSSSPPEWTYRGDHVPAAALERYFAKRLLSNNVGHTLGGVVSFEIAQPKDDPKAPPIMLKLTRLLGELDATEVYIRQAVPGRARPSEAESQARLRKVRDTIR